MNIKEVKNATKVGDFILKEKSDNKIDLKYLLELSNDILTKDLPRVYLITVDGVIKKIGGSASKGGIKSTMNFYINAMTGSPGPPRFIVHLLIEKALQNQSKVVLYIITSPKVLAKVNGLSISTEKEIASFKEMENLCKEEYFSKEKKYPDWNFQENHKPYPPELYKKHNLYHEKRLSQK